MNKFISIILFSSLIGFDSYISFYGSGEKVSRLNPSSISLGWSKLFDSNINSSKSGSSICVDDCVIPDNKESIISS